MGFYWYFIPVVLLISAFGLECNISLFPQEPVPPCSTSIVLKCSFCDLHYVRFEELADDALRFVVLTSNNILRNSDYEEVVSDGLYKLKIAQVMKYNGTQYRCHGFDGTFLKVSSAPFKLLIPTKSNCTSEVNVTVANTNGTTVVNSNQTVIINDTVTMPTENEHGLEVEPEPMLEWLGVTVVLIPLTALIAAVCVIGAYIWCKCRRHKADARDRHSVELHSVNIQSAMQADNDEDNSSIRVMLGVKVDSASTHTVTKLSNLGMQFPSNAPLQNSSREHSIPRPSISSNTAVSRASNNPTTGREMESAVAVDDSNVPMYPNPAYVALACVHQNKPQAPRQLRQLSPISEAEFSEESDVPMQENTAYESHNTLCLVPAKQFQARPVSCSLCRQHT